MNIYDVLSSIPHNPHQLKRYVKYIQSLLNQTFDPTLYTEKHHICPRSKKFFPEYGNFNKNPWNRIVLTCRQHFIAHKMLAKVYPNSVMVRAYFLMMNSRFNNGLTITSREYEITRRNCSKEMSNWISENGHPRGMLGKKNPRSPEYAARMFGKTNPAYGRKRPDLAARNMNPNPESFAKASNTKLIKHANYYGFDSYDDLKQYFIDNIEFVKQIDDIQYSQMNVTKNRLIQELRKKFIIDFPERETPSLAKFEYTIGRLKLLYPFHRFKNSNDIIARG